MLVAGAAVGVFAGNAEADHRSFSEVLFVFRRTHKMAEYVAVQFTKLFRNAEVLLVLVMFQQQNAEIIIPHVRRKVIADNPRDTQVVFLVDDGGLQYLNGRERLIRTNVQIDGDNFKLNRVAIGVGVIPARQCVEAVIDHHQGIAQVFLTLFSARQVGKVGGGTRIF